MPEAFVSPRTGKPMGPVQRKAVRIMLEYPDGITLPELAEQMGRTPKQTLAILRRINKMHGVDVRLHMVRDDA